MRFRALALLVGITATSASGCARPPAPAAPPQTAQAATPSAVRASATPANPLYENLYIATPSATAHVVLRSGEDGRIKEGQGESMDSALRFLSSGEKLLAGSWQYLNYFGRDTMISAVLLSSRAAPEFMGMAVSSVLDRVSPEGIPAHEEDIGDQATLRNLGPLLQRIKAQGPKVKLTESDLTALERAVYDYKMIDGEFLLPQLVDRFVASAGPADASVIAETFRPERLAALGRVFARIDTLTASPKGTSKPNLIAFKPGEFVGDWRDSHEGNGMGRVPLDVSA